MDPSLLPGPNAAPLSRWLVGTIVFAACAAESHDDGGGGFSSTRGAAEVASTSVSSAAAEAPKDPCTSADARPIQAFRLGQSCAGDTETLGGMCAVGAIENGATGTGEQVCFVANGAFYLGFVRYGEGIEGDFFRAGLGGAWPDQLSDDERAACDQFIATLEPLADTSANPISGERLYVPCP